MGQLAGRLKELARRHGGDARAWQSRIDAVAALEGKDEREAHARFLEVKETILHTRLADLHERLRSVGWLTGVPDLHVEDLTERGVERLIERWDAALRDARSLEQASADARGHDATLTKRALPVDFTPFDAVPLDDLPARLADAEDLRRRLAAEARVEARWRDAEARARKLTVTTVVVPDLSREEVPAPEEANRVLDAVEAALKEAEAVEDLHRDVARALRPGSVRDFKGETRKAVLRRADEAATSRDRAEAAVVLQQLLDEANKVAEEAAALARQGARARKRGARGPEKERRAGDLQDYYG